MSKRLLVYASLLIWLTGCMRKQLLTLRHSTLTAETASPAIGLSSASSIYMGGAFLMSAMGDSCAGGWSTCRDYGVGLHVHPVGWRDSSGYISDDLGPYIAANLNHKYFTYEFDIEDVRDGLYNNVQEVQKVQSFGLTCERVLCNVDTKELDTNANLPTELLNTVVIPFNNIGIAVDILFSPISPTAVQTSPGQTEPHWQRLLDSSRWTSLLFDQAHAQGVAFDYPPGYWVAGFQGNITPYLQQAQESGHEVTFLVNFDDGPGVSNGDNITNLATMFNAFKSAGYPPTRWVADNFSNSTWAPVPESDSTGAPTNHLAGAALYLARTTLPADSNEYLDPDTTKWYSILGKQSGKCLDVSGFSTSPNAKVWIWSYSGTSNELWYFRPKGNHYYEVINQNSDMCLADSASSLSEGATLVQYPITDSANELWQVIYAGDGYKVVNKLSGNVIDVQGYGTENGGTVWLWNWLSGDNQTWYFTPVAGR